MVISAVFAYFSLTGCAPTRNVMSPLQYKDTIDIHVPKVAHIYWIPGKQVAGEVQSGGYVTGSGNQGIVGALVGMAVLGVIDSHDRKHNPSKYVRDYGKADEAIFITSLRDTLERQDVFKKVELTTDLNKVGSKDVLIKVYFKTTRVNVRENNLITLTVNLLIQSGHQPQYERTYLIQNDPLVSKTLLERKTEVSQKLLTAVIGGIKQWHRGEK